MNCLILSRASHNQKSNPIVSANNLITELLGAPLHPDWTVERLAEKVLDAIAVRHTGEGEEFVLEADTAPDCQSSIGQTPRRSFQNS